jgi:hypothetical protein
MPMSGNHRPRGHDEVRGAHQFNKVWLHAGKVAL